MENKKKLLLQVLFLLVVFAGTIYGVFHGEDLGKILHIISTVNPLYLLPAVACVVFFIWGESIIIFYMMHTLNIHLRKWTCFLFSSIGFFFSCITPSASGGQPAQIYYMKKEDIPIPVSTLVLMVVTITYKAVLVFIGLAILIFGNGFIKQYLTGILPVFHLGIFLNVLCVIAMFVLVFHTTLAKDILIRGLWLLEKLHLMKKKESRHQRLDAAMTEYQDTAVYLKEHKQVIINVLAITFAQRFALFLSTYFVYRAFGLKEYSVAVIVLLQAVISISVDMLPLPGGMGISETLFLTIFVPVFGAKLLLPGMILSRGLSYYTELILSAALTVLANFTIGGKKKICKKKNKF
ncbi:MAG: lysylphosphatidylglycerol synthase transmembrane domain-containing protein [Hespellia sp.]|nr:lysylphosphatidylglycerol synthase transmembrane domain-containing protein [Hespellia sp.]